MGFGFKNFEKGVRLVPVLTTSLTLKGDLEVRDADGKLYLFNGTAAGAMVTEDGVATLTNKVIDGSFNTITNIPAGALPANTATTNTAQTFTNKAIDADLNTITNIDNADIKAGAAIARSKIASGSANHVVINDGIGVLSSEAQLSITRGGTGQATAIAAFGALASTTTKGDIIVHNGTDNIRLPVGTNSQVLTANSATASGLEWTNSAVANNSIDEFKLTTSVAGNGLAGGNGTALSVNVDNSTLEINTDTLRIKNAGIALRYTVQGDSQSMINNTTTPVLFTTQVFDTNSAYNTGTGIFTAPVTGLYQVSACMVSQGLVSFGVGTQWSTRVYVDTGSGLVFYCNLQTTVAHATHSVEMCSNGSTTVSLVAGNTVQIQVFQNRGGNAIINTDPGINFLDIFRII